MVRPAKKIKPSIKERFISDDLTIPPIALERCIGYQYDDIGSGSMLLMHKLGQAVK